MTHPTKPAFNVPATDALLRRSELVFIAVGLCIILGGLWFVYDAMRPHHPVIPVTDTL